MSDKGGRLGKTAEKVRSRSRRRRKVLFSLGTLFCLGLVLVAGYQFWLRDSSLVEIRDLEVKGVPAETEGGGEIIKAVETATDGMTTLHLEPDRLAEELSRFPRVASSEIDAKIPNAATVTITLRENGSIAGSGSDAVLVATDGAVLGPADASDDGLPVIEGARAPEGRQLEGQELAVALVLGSVPKELGSFVDKGESGKEGVVVTLSNGLELRFGDALALEEKWRAAASVIADPELSGASYVDLSVPRRPAVGGSETVEPE